MIIPAAQAPEIASSRALRVAKEFDGDGNMLRHFYTSNFTVKFFDL